MSEKEFPVIEVGGTPYEIGFQHGEKAKDRVAKSLETYRPMFEDYAGIPWETAKIRAREYIKPIERYDPDLLEEMRGVADGAGLPFDEILALNARSEIIFQGGEALPEGCTSIAVAKERAENGEALIGQNWEWKTSQRAACVLLKIRQKGKPDIFMATEAGIIGKVGFNSAGVAVCLNAMSAARPPDGLPLHLALRGVLNSWSLPDAIRAAGREKLGCCAFFMVGGKDGEVAGIEIGPDDFDVLYPENGAMAHANHFKSPRLTGFCDTLKWKFPDTYARDGRANKLLSDIRGNIGVKDLKKIFSDHAGYPDSLCRHDDLRDPEGLRVGEVFSMIVNLKRQEVEIAVGEPCQNPYIRYTL